MKLCSATLGVDNENNLTHSSPNSVQTCVCLGGGGSPASRPHGEPAGDVQNPKYPCWNTGASGGDTTDSIWRQ